MNSQSFIKEIKKIRDQSCIGVIENLEAPPGRKPREKDIALSEFYNSLSDDQKIKMKAIVIESIDMAMFSFFCVLDHVHAVEDDEAKTTFELYSIKEHEKTLINDGKEEPLHDQYNARVLNDDEED